MAKRSKKGELSFYSLFSGGIILQALGRPWLEVEERLLTCFEQYPHRGEPIAHLIDYYLSKKEWSVGYIYSQYAREQLFGRTPNQDKWAVDEKFYAWRCLDVHTAICFSLQKMQEATETYKMLYQTTMEHPDWFHPNEINRIHSHRNLFRKVAKI